MNLDYLDILYTWKVEAEQKLEIFEEKLSDYIYDENDIIDKKLHDLEKHKLEEIANRCKNAIRVYISHHFN